MTRPELCEILREYRKVANIPVRIICAELICLPSDIYRIESGKQNFRLSKCVSYLNFFNKTLLIVKNRESYKIASDKDAIDALEKIRGDKSTGAIEKKAGISTSALHYVLKGKTNLSVDMFLLVFYTLGCKIRIVNKS